MRFDRSKLVKPIPLILLILLFLGAAFGQWIGNRFRMMDEERHMNIYMSALLLHTNRLAVSARETIEAANRSPYEMCSSQDMAYLRKLVFSAYHVKDIGRLRDDRLMCSTLLSDVHEHSKRSPADVHLSDGTYVYGERPLITPGSRGFVIGRGTANVVLSSAAFDLLHTPQYSFAVYMRDAQRKHFARLYAYRSDDFPVPDFNNHRGEYEVFSDVVKEYRCDDEVGICIALRAQLDSSSTSARWKSFIATSLGLFAGATLGLGWFAYHNRERPLASMLRQALNARELEVVYQPVVNVEDAKLTGFEALLRWQLHTGDMIPPDVFIAEAEEKGMAGRVTAYVADRVIDDMGDLLRRNRNIQINVNVTASDVQAPAFQQDIRRKLTSARISPGQIGFELTERTAVDFAKASEGIRQLREQGHKVYIDDFGTGYSSLSYLGELQIDAIKIDKAFTRTVCADGDTVSIVPQIISMARQHNLGIVVEGIETEAQADYFRRMSTPMTAQGWFYGKPLNPRDAIALVTTGSPATGRKRSKALYRTV
ncbi:EAL domain-containing protein [Ochrobactrum sp. AP1BH01-1]|uniref:EAL domain-containing protein n=1 Tax=Ochrobactrum sp. AP1BH01-1 TaxID=2823874 RepID=UPI000DD7791D|nr:EAL domain-containing protein [Ochrobactrum sp. AP1BH01-1]MBQ0709600.1 EAL domain-containing protein [Ochrobactrum sp. AP1BH01-1]